MERNCLVNDLVYKCDVTRRLSKKVYLELARGERKNRFYKHKLSFKHKRHSNKATLSSYVWCLKSVSSETPNLKWSDLRCVSPYSNISKKCLLCLHEKLEILRNHHNSFLTTGFWSPNLGSKKSSQKNILRSD